MDTQEPTFTDGQARAIIVAAEGLELADADRLSAVAAARSFVPPQTDLPLLDSVLAHERTQAAIAFLWTTDRPRLVTTIGDLATLALIPETARFPCRCSPRRESDYY